MDPEYSPATETDVAQNQDAGGWLGQLLTGAISAYGQIATIDATKQAAKVNAQLQQAQLPSVSTQAATQANNTKTILIVGGVAVVGLILILALRK